MLKRKEQLLAAGFTFDTLEDSWERRLRDYVIFRNKNGQEPSLAGKTNEEQSLAQWVTKQRSFWKSGQLSFKREEQLRSIGFVFDTIEAVWQDNLRAYTQFTNANGREPSRHSKADEEKLLANWKARQRDLWRKETLSPKREEQLLVAGFVFEPFDANWQSVLRDYFAFKNQHGREPSHTGKTNEELILARWSNVQRSTWKRGTLPPRRERQLLLLGFDFDPYETVWQQHRRDYIAFKNEHGRDPTSRGKAKNEKPLADWACRQRELWRKGRLATERVEQLQAVGFNFGAKKQNSATLSESFPSKVAPDASICQLFEADKGLLYKDYLCLKSLGLLRMGDECLKDLAETYGVTAKDILKIVDEVEDKMCGAVSGLLVDACQRSEDCSDREQREKEEFVLS